MSLLSCGVPALHTCTRRVGACCHKEYLATFCACAAASDPCVYRLIRLVVTGVDGQVIKDAKSSEKADVYAFGILLWELATREQVRVVSPPEIRIHLFCFYLALGVPLSFGHGHQATIASLRLGASKLVRGYFGEKKTWGGMDTHTSKLHCYPFFSPFFVKH